MWNAESKNKCPSLNEPLVKKKGGLVACKFTKNIVRVNYL